MRKSYYQFFCGEEFFQNRLVFDRPPLTRYDEWFSTKAIAATMRQPITHSGRLARGGG
ncbi:hypothetical protein [Bradyrhizobium sp. CCBAU 051011]|uniref:hypothetical protein n=1 Tax=Bradyrhizobium sp. CCBAU 051011 TaxID=858422 RepID=UPI00137B05C6|nr:hypothetical protein [Bradyrhizobium sp. CCBAU 051011]